MAPAQDILKILVLEDDDLDFQVLERHVGSLFPRRYDLIRAKCANDARDMITGIDIAAALIDYRLSDGNSGLDFIKELGGREADFPSIILTGIDSGILNQEAILTGAYDYIDKIALTRELVDRSIQFAISSHKYERQLRNSMKEAEEQAAINREILAVVSHEMQSPVSSLIGYCDQIAESCQTDGTRLSIGKMKVAAVHLEDFLRNLSEYVRLNKGGGEICNGEFRPQSLLQETIEFFSPYTKHKEITVQSEFDPSTSEMFVGDSVRIRQVLINLVKNAVKYSDMGTITVSASIDNGVFTVLVKDNGVGMSEEKVAAILDGSNKWQRPGKELRSGLGLGLSICARLLQLMRGKLILESTPGHGTTAGFEVPLTKASAAVAA